MSQMQTSLILTGDARGLIASTQQGQRGIDQLGQSVAGLAREQKSARDSADVFNREIDQQIASVTQLRSSLDPAFLATQRLEAGQQTLNRAVRSGAISNREYEGTLELLQAQYRQTTNAIEMQNTATRRLTTSTAGGAGGMTNFSYQLQDIFTQVGMGVPLMISLGQQAPQILSGFGSIGAIAGVAAAAILPLTAVIFGLGYGSKEAADEVKSSSELMREAFDAISTAQSTMKTNSVSNLDAIKEKYGEVTQSVLTLMIAQNDLAMQRAAEGVRSGVTATFDDQGLGRLNEYARTRSEIIDELERQLSAARSNLAAGIDPAGAQAAIDDYVRDLEDYAAGLDIKLDFGQAVDQETFQNLQIYQNGVKDAFAAENYEGALSVVVQLREVLQAIPDGPLRDSLAGIVDIEDALRQAINTGEENAAIYAQLEVLAQRVGDVDVSSNLAAGADQASRMANELSRAVSNAIALANQGVGEVDRARINYQFRDDPIGRADQLARLEFDSRVETPSGPLPDGAARMIDQEREAFAGARREAAQYTLQLQEWRKQQTAAARGSAGGGGSGGRSRGRSDEDRILQDIERQMDRLAPSYERDISALEEWRSEALATLDPARAGYEAFATDVETIFSERLAQAYREDLDRRTDWSAGIERSFADINKNMITWADVGEDLATKWSSGMEDAFVEMGRTGKFEVGSLIDYTLEQFQRLAFQQAIQPGIEAGFGFLTDFIGGFFPSAGSTPLTQSHSGSTIGTGGVRRSYGASSPLRADERLTVTTMGQRVFTPEQIGNGATVVDALARAASANSGSGNATVFAPNISIENRGSTPVQGEMEEQSDGQGGRSFKLVLADQVGAAMNQPGGGARKTLKRGGFKPKRAQR